MAKLTFKDQGQEAPGQDEARAAEKARSAKPTPADAAAKRRSKGKEVRKGGASDQAAFGKENAEFAPSLFKGDGLDAADKGPDYAYRRIRLRKADEVNPYAQQEDARRAMDPRARKVLIMAVVLLIVFFFSATLPTGVASPVARSNNSLAAFLRDFGMQVQGLIVFFTGGQTVFGTYVWEIVAAGLAGAALGLSGGVYQGAMKNALASPSTLGVTQGGTLGLIIYGVFIYRGDWMGTVDEYLALTESMNPLEYVMEVFGAFFSSLLGCFIIVALIMLIATLAGRGRVTNVSLIIAGQVFAAVIGVAVTAIRYYLTVYAQDPVLIELLQEAQSVSFSGSYTALTVGVFAVPLVACMAVVFAMAPRLSLLAFDDEEARSLGISPRFTRNLMVAVCTVLTALVVSFTGPIGFVGFMCPHIARRFTGPDFRYLLPASALLGAILVVAVHYVSYMGIPGFVVGSTGVFTSILGCIMFIVMALRSRGDKHAEWI